MAYQLPSWISEFQLAREPRYLPISIAVPNFATLEYW